MSHGEAHMQNKLTSLAQNSDSPFSVDGHMPLPMNANAAATRGEMHPDQVNM